MIPKIIHYCWLSDFPLPNNVQKCIESWKKYMPDYQIKRWSTKNFDINSITLVKEAYNAQKWAFAADYIRVYALYTEGGIYLDSDVMLYGNLEPLLDSDFVSGIEYHPSFEEEKLNLENCILDKTGKRCNKNKKVYGIGIQAAVLAARKEHPLMKKCIDFYANYTLKSLLEEQMTAPAVIANNAEEFGFIYKDKEQKLSSSIHLYPTTIISNYDQKSKISIAVHYCAGSWTNKSIKKQITKTLNRYKLYRIIRNTIKDFLYKKK